ncbi:restriction endonuclease subunit S [Proteus mirabilis]|uniref:restriction endonuclease subunit S n=1 Tax=Proteus mirabilis TaxID=584 RepID=UPI0034DD8871
MEQVLYSLPDGWEWHKLKDLTTKIGSGATPKGGEKAYKSSGISLIRSLNVHDCFFKEEKLAFIDDGQANGLKNVVVESGDVLLNITGASIARCCIVPNEFLPARVNQHVTIIRPTEYVDSKFLNYLIVNPKFKAQLLWQGAGGATRQALTKTMVEELNIPLPSLPEQKRIVEKLDALLNRIDTAIEHLQESVTLADALYASTIHEQMMQAIELAGLSTVEKHIEQIQTGTTPPTKQPEFYENGNINWFAPSDFGDHDILSDSNKKLSQKAFDAGKARKFDAGTIMLVAIGATIGKIGYLEQDASSNQQITGMKFNSDIIPRYAYYWFRFIKPEILTNASTATLPIINQKGIKALSFCAPNKQLQETICKKIDEVSNFRNTVKAELIEKVELMRSLKASILDSAFKGEL